MHSKYQQIVLPFCYCLTTKTDSVVLNLYESSVIHGGGGWGRWGVVGGG